MPDNRHATIVLLGDRGVAITGASGTGKSTLALALIARWRAMGAFARLVGDDQIYLAAVNGRAVATVPGPIAGMVEVFGIGARRIAFERRAVIDLALELLPDEGPRLEETALEILPGIAVPLVRLSRCNVAAAVNVAAALIGGDIFAAVPAAEPAPDGNSLR